MRLCDNCKREPEQFDIEGSTERGWWFRVAKDGGAAVLMEDLEFAFCAVTEKEPIDDPEHFFWCKDCMNTHLENFEEK